MDLMEIIKKECIKQNYDSAIKYKSQLFGKIKKAPSDNTQMLIIDENDILDLKVGNIIVFTMDKCNILIILKST